VILHVHLPGAHAYQVGDEIWDEPLGDVIRAEADAIAASAGCEQLAALGHADRGGLRDQIIAEMTLALRGPGDCYRAPDGVLYTLEPDPAADAAGGGRLAGVSCPVTDPVVDVVLRFEALPVGSSASRRAIVPWSDGTESEALRWFDDEVLVSGGGDLLNKTRAQLRSLHFRRDRDWLQS
jgi:hypothetical protein